MLMKTWKIKERDNYMYVMRRVIQIENPIELYFSTGLLHDR